MLSVLLDSSCWPLLRDGMASFVFSFFSVNSEQSLLDENQGILVTSVQNSATLFIWMFSVVCKYKAEQVSSRPVSQSNSLSIGQAVEMCFRIKCSLDEGIVALASWLSVYLWPRECIPPRVTGTATRYVWVASFWRQTPAGAPSLGQQSAWMCTDSWVRMLEIFFQTRSRERIIWDLRELLWTDEAREGAPRVPGAAPAPVFTAWSWIGTLGPGATCAPAG